MPCKGCPDTQKSVNPILLHPVLDRTELFLTSAWVSEIRPEQKENVTQLIKAVQALKNPYTVPLEAQLANLAEVASQVGFSIPCYRCRGAWFQDVVRSIQVRSLLEQGKRKQATWLYMKKEFWGKVWLLRALPSLLNLQSHPADPQVTE